MKYEIKVKRTLKTDNKKVFTIGEDIAFTIFNFETNSSDRYIGEIKEITDDTITIRRIIINGKPIGGKKTFLLRDIESDSCNYVFCD